MAEPVDTRQLQQLLSDIGGDREAMQEFFGSFFTTAPKLLAQAREASAAGNADAYRRAVHTLKSSAAMFGAAALSQLARAEEARAAEGRLDGSSAAVEQMLAEYARVEQALRAWSP